MQRLRARTLEPDCTASPAASCQPWDAGPACLSLKTRDAKPGSTCLVRLSGGWMKCCRSIRYCDLLCVDLHYSPLFKNICIFYWNIADLQCFMGIATWFSSVQSLSRVRPFATPWTAAHQASLSVTISQSLLKFMSIDSVMVMPSNHLILCRPLLLLPSIFPTIRVFSNESVLCIRWPEYWSYILIKTSILFQTLFHYRSLQEIACSSLGTQ